MWITRKQQKVKWAGVFCGRCAPVFASIIVIVIDFLGVSVRQTIITSSLSKLFRPYRIPKRFWFRYPDTTSHVSLLRQFVRPIRARKRLFMSLYLDTNFIRPEIIILVSGYCTLTRVDGSYVLIRSRPTFHFIFVVFSNPLEPQSHLGANYLKID